jgi:hypothetical protein
VFQGRGLGQFTGDTQDVSGDAAQAEGVRGELEAGMVQPFGLWPGQIAQAASVGSPKEDEPIGIQFQALVIVAKENLAWRTGHFRAVFYPQVQSAPRGKGRRYRYQTQRPEKVLTGYVECAQMGIGDSLHRYPSPASLGSCWIVLQDCARCKAATWSSTPFMLQ